MNLLDELTTNGPQATSALAAKWVAEGLSADAARKRLSRVGGNVKRLLNVGLPKGEAILYLEEHVKDGTYFDAVPRILKEQSAAYSRAIHALEARGGTVPRASFAAISGAPVHPAKGQVPHAAIEQRLIDIRVLSTAVINGVELIGLGEPDLSSRRRAAQIVENVTLSLLKTWLMKLGMASGKATKTRTEADPTFGPYRWDMVGPSYLYPFAGLGAGDTINNGFLVADILMDREITLEDLGPFLQKCSVSAHQGRRGKMLPMFVGDRFAPAAFDELRKRGFLLARPEHIFGEEAAKLLRELIQSIEHIAALTVREPAKMEKLIGQLLRLEGAVANTYGIVFEFLVARLFVLTGHQIQMRQTIRHEGEKAEIDIKAATDWQVVCVETKAKMPGNLVDAPEIQDWLDRPLPRIKGYLATSSTLPENKSFEFWTSTDYTDDAKALIARIKAQHKRQPITFYNGVQTRERLREKKQSSLVDIFDEQFRLR